MPISVNFSRRHNEYTDFVPNILKRLKDYKVPSELLEVEVTESVFMSDLNKLTNNLETLRDKGVEISVDDFGSGYSSLNILKNLPIQVLKLDILFFRKSVDIARERIIIRNILTMAHELQMKTIAEGVETAEQVEFLKAAGCDIVQGYVYFKPMPLADFDQVLQAELDQPQGCRERAATV